MAMSATNQNLFDLFITCVDKVGPMLKIWGQGDRLSSMFVEQLLKTASTTFDIAPTNIQLNKMQVGVLCCAKYKDGEYYRAQITNIRNILAGSVEVKFIDYGNIENIQLENIRLLENVAVGLSTMKPQASDFILANIVHINQNWDEKALAFVHSDIAYIESKCTIVGAVNNFIFIKVSFHGTDLSDYLVQKGIAIQIPLASQENIIRNAQQIPRMVNMQQHVPQQVQMQQQQQRGPVYQVPAPHLSPMPELCRYKTLPLEPNSEHMVYVSYVEDGPQLFSIQLQSMEDALTKLMIEINETQNLLPLSETPLPGHPCMARCLEDQSLCRAVVINLVEDKCKTFYVDFGNTDILPFSNIYQIPFKYMLPKVMSMRFTLYGLKNINVTTEMKCAFKEYVTNKLLKLKVLKLENVPVIQYCELYDEQNQNIINVLYGSINQYKTIQINKGLKYNVIVSYIEGCKKFFVQLKDSSELLANLMRNLQTNCEGFPALQKLEVGTPCVAFYSADNQWYRAQIVSVNDNNTVSVKYVDYGNVDNVALNYVKKLDPSFVKILPAQAIECCLYGYQNMYFNSEIENVFESLTLEFEFAMKVICKQNNDTTILVDLFDISGNNVAALLIDKLASQKSELLSPGPLPATKVTRSLSLLNDENEVTNLDKIISNPKSPKQDKYSWRNSENDKHFKKSDSEKSWKSTGNDRKTQRGSNDRKSWRSSENSPPKLRNNRKIYNKKRNRENNRNQNGWNGDSPTNKRSQRPERSFSRNSKENDYHDNKNKFRSDKFDNNKPRSDKRISPQNDYGRKNTNWNSGSESEKSWSGNSVGNRSGKSVGSRKEFNKDKTSRRNNDHPKKNDFGGKQNSFVKSKPELPPQDLVPFEEPFKYPVMDSGIIENVSISWFYDPENFFCQLISSQTEFRDMMTDIQTAYNGRPGINGDIPVGSSVIAEFLEDTCLYRATIIENKYPKYKVQYIDFGNMSLVDCKKIWQVEKRFMTLPVQAIKCGISNLKPSGENWTAANEIDHIFNKDSFTAIFEGCDEEKYYVQLLCNETDGIRQQLIDSGLGVDSNAAIQMADEPVDLNILLGQNLKIEISFIQDLSKFYIHLEREKAALVHETIQLTPNESLQQFTEDLIIIGSTCLVKVDDTIFKRGVITNNADLNAIKIDYPDFGGGGTYASNQLYILPPQLCAYWYQAFECSLHNLTADSTKIVSDDSFKQDYENKEVIIYIDDILDGRLIVTLYDTNGSKLNLITPDDGAYPTIEPICQLPILNVTLSAWISHINSVDSIYIQKNSDTDKIATLLQGLFEHYENLETTGEFKEGDLCVAKSVVDNNWYRSRVQKIENDNATIVYIDYGNNETLPLTNLKPLDFKLFGTHEYALNVALNLQEISDQLVDKLKELTSDKLLHVNIMYGEIGWFVELFDETTNINQTLIDLKLASPLGESLPIETIAEEVISTSENQLTEIDESKAQIIITHIDSPSEFYVQLVANEDSIAALQADLQEKIANLPDLDGADIGVLCAAKYTVDEHWYRAEVLDADSEITTVRFIDYGNTDVITNNQSTIKTLPADLLAIDKYARKCSLNVMPVKSEEWSQEASELFESLVNVDVIFADIVYQDEKNKTYVELYVNGNNIAQELLNSNLAIPISRDMEDNIASNTGFVSHLNSISEFWIQLESSVPDLEMIADRLSNAETFPDLQDLSPGILCAANFPDDEMWYRARILSNTVAGIEVLFLDYGNSSTAMKLKVLPEELIQMPILAQKCSLNKPANVSVWSEQAIEKFREISADGVTIFTIKKLTAGETSIVELFIDGQNILDQLVELCDLTSLPASPVSQPNLPKVHITYVESPDHFWIQLNSDTEKIDEMIEKLSVANTFEKLVDFNADTTCAALHRDSGLWYRAKIYEACDEYEVLLVDFGNTICTNELRILPKEIEDIPPLATLCALELPNNLTEWSSFATSNFNSILTDTKSDCRIEFLDNEVPSKVRLFVDGKNIAEQICVETPQEPLTSSTTVSLTSDEVTLLAVNTQLPEPEVNADEEIEIAECDIINKDESCQKKQEDDTSEQVNSAEILTNIALNNKLLTIVDDIDIHIEECFEENTKILTQTNIDYESLNKDNINDSFVLTEDNTKDNSLDSNVLTDDNITNQINIDELTIVDEISSREENKINTNILINDDVLDKTETNENLNENINNASLGDGNEIECNLLVDQTKTNESSEDLTTEQNTNDVSSFEEDKIECNTLVDEIKTNESSEDLTNEQNTNDISSNEEDKIECNLLVDQTKTNESSENLTIEQNTNDISSYEENKIEFNTLVDEIKTKESSEEIIEQNSNDVSLFEENKIECNLLVDKIKTNESSDILTIEENTDVSSNEENIIECNLLVDQAKTNESSEDLTIEQNTNNVSSLEKNKIEFNLLVDRTKTNESSEDLSVEQNTDDVSSNEENKIECNLLVGQAKTNESSKDLTIEQNTDDVSSNEENKTDVNLITDVDLDETNDNYNQLINDTELNESIIYRSQNSPSEKIDPKKPLEETIEQIEISSRPQTPHCDKIVPGSISRGDLENPEDNTDNEFINSFEEIKEDIKNSSRPSTPHNDKIVPGSICRGEEKIKCDFEPDTITRPATPLSEKIVPGSIARGDLTEPPKDENIVTETERPETPKIPVDEKIVPGCLTQGIDLKED